VPHDEPFGAAVLPVRVDLLHRLLDLGHRLLLG
jgi:hypothetical protein